MTAIDDFEKQQEKSEVPEFEVGDTLDVHVRITEGDKERIQVFTGTCIGRRGKGLRETFQVRRIVMGEGVERTFPVHSPKIEKVVVKRRSKVRRAKLNFLRQRVGKGTRLRERRVDAKKAAPKKESNNG